MDKLLAVNHADYREAVEGTRRTEVAYFQGMEEEVHRSTRVCCLPEDFLDEVSVPKLIQVDAAYDSQVVGDQEAVEDNQDEALLKAANDDYAVGDLEAADGHQAR